MRRALFAGSFNPFTIGHRDLVERGLQLFDEIVIAFGYNEHKGRSPETDREMRRVAERFSADSRVSVVSYSGLTADFARECGAGCLLRGVRDMTDYEYERKLADANREVLGLDTVILVASPRYSYISSSMLRELAHNGYDIEKFLG